MFTKIRQVVQLKHMKNKIILSLVTLLLLVCFSITDAARREPEINIRQMPLVEQLPVQEDNIIQQQDERENYSSPITRRMISNFNEVVESRIEEIKQQRIETQQRIEENSKLLQDKISQRKLNLQNRINEISSEARRTRAQILVKNIEKVNDNLISRYNGYLDAQEIVLDKIESRVFKTEQQKNKNMDLFYTRIDSARNLIKETREKIIEHGSLIYIPEITSQENIRQDFQETIEEMKSKHRELRQETILPLRSLINDIFSSLKNEIL